MARFGDTARRILLVAAAALVPAGAAVAQRETTTTLVGSVHDSTGHALAGVEVRIRGGALLARTNDEGGFRLGAVPVGHLVVGLRRLGYAPLSTEVTLREGRVDSLVVSLIAMAHELPGVVVEDEAMARSKRFIAGFWERRARGFGGFITRQQIEERRAANFADLVRMLPSTDVATLNGRPAIRFRRNPGIRDCPPQYWVDGQRIEMASPDEFSPEEVEAIEVYPGAATLPVQFAPRPGSYTCGAIVIWTRVPGA